MGKELWQGKQAEDVRSRKLTYNLLYAWIFTFGVVIPIILVVNHFGKSAISVIIVSLMGGIVLLAAAASDWYWAALTRYQVTERKIALRVERDVGEYEEIQLSKIRRTKLKRSLMDVAKLNTGSILFFIGNKKKAQMEFKHIARVDEVYKLINDLTNASGENLERNIDEGARLSEGTSSIEHEERVLIYSFVGFWSLGYILLIIADLFLYSDLILFASFLIISPLSSLFVLWRGAHKIKKIRN